MELPPLPKEQKTILEKLYRNENLLFVPIRHHSPQCAMQLKHAIADFRPDVLLIEGPSEANHLINALVDEQTKPPIALYIYSDHSASQRPEQPSLRQRCYAPFADFSPEWQALKMARQLGIAAQFIDLPYAQQLHFCDRQNQLDKETSMQHDASLATADAMERLVQQSECRDFNQWWDRYFESAYIEPNWQSYFMQLHMLCILVRNSATVTSQCIAREQFMAAKINAYLEQGKRCLVVCGGFHCSGINQLLLNPEDIISETNSVNNNSHAYLISYSLNRLDQLNLYQAGMPNVGYYQKFWQIASQKSHAQSAQQTTLTQMMAQAVNQLQKRSTVSTADAIEAVAMANRLAALRGQHVGRVEVKDAIVSCLIKEPQENPESVFEQQLVELFSGNKKGSIPSNLPIAPLVSDFKAQCQHYKLPITGAQIEKTLDIYKSERHREISQLLHKLRFLNIPYGQFIAGPQFVSGHNLYRVREIWHIKWSPDTQANLIECCHYGDSLHDAAFSAVLHQLHGLNRDGHVNLLISALCMGLHQTITPIIERVENWLNNTHNIAELCTSLRLLNRAYRCYRLLSPNHENSIKNLLYVNIERLLNKLSWSFMLPEELIDSLMEALKTINSLSQQNTLNTEQEKLFCDTLDNLSEQLHISKIAGLATGILTLNKTYDTNTTSAKFSACFANINLELAQPGLFVAGFLSIARAQLIQSSQLISLLEKLFMSWSEDEFIAGLPHLRHAFCELTPRELNQLANTISNKHAPIIESPSNSVSTTELTYAQQLKQGVSAVFNAWQLGFNTNE